MSVVDIVMSVPKKIFGTRNDRILKRMAPTVEQTVALEPELRALCCDGDDYDAAFEARRGEIPQPDEDDAEAVVAYERQLQEIRIELSKPLRERSDALVERLSEGASTRDAMPEAFAILREASRRARDHRHFDCQIIGGQTLYDGNIAEMKTGEGKTIVCHLAIYLRITQGMNVHVVTVNDYLVQRDAEFAMPIFELLGYTVGYIQAMVDPGGREGVRKRMYDCNITYGTTSEFGFDYLRDNMKIRREEQVQGKLEYVIIDEVDSILIDEARTPLIISGPAHGDISRYPRANRVAEELVRKQAVWDRRVMSTVAKFDGDTQSIPKLDDAMAVLGSKEKIAERSEKSGDDADDQDEADKTKGPKPTLGPDFLTDDQVEAIQIYENNVLQKPLTEQYRRLFIVQMERKQAALTHDGVTAAQESLDVGSIYSGANMEWPHLIENALRAHKVYKRDIDYVVKDRQIIIVDPFTGRLMHGRQWSDGLHQAVEAKETVPVKEETQTLATITIQNFFKLYEDRAGMTGTAQTEASEFLKIYKLDVVEIPTNRPVNRVDYNDKMYRSIDDKFSAIVDEIHEVHQKGRPADPFILADLFAALKSVLQKQGQDTSRIEEALKRFNSAEEGDKKTIRFMCETYDEVMGDMAVGRPILVGTTSVENSEKISRLLERRYGIDHEVLNAKNHAREAEIVLKAGHQTIPLRGKDKTPKGNVTIATNMAGRGTDIKLGQTVVYPTCKVPEELPTGSNASPLYPTGVTKCCLHCEEYDPATNCAHCFKPKLDPRFPELGRKVCPINVPCGLHIVGTERHEARRIDNQLRGRSGRQGDPGSSRFFLSLQDDLLKLFMTDRMLGWMERFGFAEGTSLEHKSLTKGIAKAQRKVEETNFSRRKSLLEWDEPMDFQRKEFYRSRQQILERKGLEELIFGGIDDSSDTATGQFLGGNYRQRCVVEWCRSNLDVVIDEEKIDLEDLEAAQQGIRQSAKDEAHDSIRTSIGEYIDPDEPAAQWDVGGLLHWAQRMFKVPLTQNQMRKMDIQEIEDVVCEAANEHYDAIDLDGISIYLDERFPHRALADWAQVKFEIELTEDELIDRPVEDIGNLLGERVRAQYRRREISYPVEYCMAMAYGGEGVDQTMAAQIVAHWVNAKFRLGWEASNIEGKSPEDVRQELQKINEDFITNGRLENEIREHTGDLTREQAVTWGKERFGRAWGDESFDAFEGNLVDALIEQGHRMLRWELTDLEQRVLLHIYDQAWKDHLLEMDHLKSAIQQRPLGGDQTHPQSQYAIEGRDLFRQMWDRIAARVTDIIFKVRATGGGGREGRGEEGGGRQSPTGGPAGGPAPMQLQHGDATNMGFASASADRAAAMQAQGQEAKVETIRRDAPRVGRNDPCPCGSGKKYKQCHGKQ